MSRENVEIVRTTLGSPTFDLIDLFGGPAPGGAIGDVDLSRLAPDVEVTFVGSEPGLGDLKFKGWAGFAEGWRDWLEAWRSYVVEVEDFVDAGSDVVVLVRLKGETMHGGVTMEQQAAAVWTIEDCMAVRVAFHLDRRAALESVGLSDHGSDVRARSGSRP